MGVDHLPARGRAVAHGLNEVHSIPSILDSAGLQVEVAFSRMEHVLCIRGRHQKRDLSDWRFDRRQDRAVTRHSLLEQQRKQSAPPAESVRITSCSVSTQRAAQCRSPDQSGQAAAAVRVSRAWTTAVFKVEFSPVSPAWEHLKSEAAELVFS